MFYHAVRGAEPEGQLRRNSSYESIQEGGEQLVAHNDLAQLNEVPSILTFCWKIISESKIPFSNFLGAGRIGFLVLR